MPKPTECEHRPIDARYGSRKPCRSENRGCDRVLAQLRQRLRQGLLPVTGDPVAAVGPVRASTTAAYSSSPPTIRSSRPWPLVKAERRSGCSLAAGELVTNWVLTRRGRAGKVWSLSQSAQEATRHMRYPMQRLAGIGIVCGMVLALALMLGVRQTKGDVYFPLIVSAQNQTATPVPTVTPTNEPMWNHVPESTNIRIVALEEDIASLPQVELRPFDDLIPEDEVFNFFAAGASPEPRALVVSREYLDAVEAPPDGPLSGSGNTEYQTLLGVLWNYHTLVVLDAAPYDVAVSLDLVDRGTPWDIEIPFPSSPADDEEGESVIDASIYRYIPEKRMWNRSITTRDRSIDVSAHPMLNYLIHEVLDDVSPQQSGKCTPPENYVEVDYVRNYHLIYWTYRQAWLLRGTNPPLGENLDNIPLCCPSGQIIQQVQVFAPVLCRNPFPGQGATVDYLFCVSVDHSGTAGEPPHVKWVFNGIGFDRMYNCLLYDSRNTPYFVGPDEDYTGFHCSNAPTAHGVEYADESWLGIRRLFDEVAATDPSDSVRLGHFPNSNQVGETSLTAVVNVPPSVEFSGHLNQDMELNQQGNQSSASWDRRSPYLYGEGWQVNADCLLYDPEEMCDLGFTSSEWCPGGGRAVCIPRDDIGADEADSDQYAITIRDKLWNNSSDFVWGTEEQYTAVFPPSRTQLGSQQCGLEMVHSFCELVGIALYPSPRFQTCATPYPVGPTAPALTATPSCPFCTPKYPPPVTKTPGAWPTMPLVNVFTATPSEPTSTPSPTP